MPTDHKEEGQRGDANDTSRGQQMGQMGQMGQMELEEHHVTTYEPSRHQVRTVTKGQL